MGTYDGQYASAVAGARTAGQGAEDAYLQRARAFDPYAAANTSAQAQFNSFREMLNRDLRSLRGSQVGAGRMRSGFGTQDEDYLVTDNLSRLNDAVASRAMQAASMEQQNTAQMGQYGLQQQQSYYDLLSGGMDRQQMQQNAKKSRWANLAGGLGALAGGAIGTFLLLGIGTQLGASLGGGLGRGVGGMV